MEKFSDKFECVCNRDVARDAYNKMQSAKTLKPEKLGLLWLTDLAYVQNLRNITGMTQFSTKLGFHLKTTE